MTSTDSHQVAVNILGTSFVLDTNDPATSDDIRRLWRPFVDLHPDPAGRVITVGGATASDRLRDFATAVNAAALDAAPDLAVHAGVVAHHGVAIAMPATSGTGKSTMTAACLRRGFDYVSDEALCLRYSDGSVRPYPRPIALSPWSAAAVGAPVGTVAGDELLLTAEDLGDPCACRDSESEGRRGGLDAAPRLGHIVILDRRAAGPPSITPTPRPAGVTLLLRLSFNHYRRPADAVRLAAQVVAAATVSTLHYADPVEAADLLWSTFVESGKAAQSSDGSSGSTGGACASSDGAGPASGN